MLHIFHPPLHASGSSTCGWFGLFSKSHSPNHLTASKPAGFTLQSSLKAVVSRSGSVSAPTVVPEMKVWTRGPWGITFWSLMEGMVEEMKVLCVLKLGLEYKSL